MWVMELMNVAVTLFWLSLFCLVVYRIVRALIGATVRPPADPQEDALWRKKRADYASLWMLLASLATPFWLTFCYKLAQGSGSNAAPGLGGFLALVLGFPCVVVFLSTLKVWLDTLKSKT